MLFEDYIIVVDGCGNKFRILKKYFENFKSGLEWLKELVVKYKLSPQLSNLLDIVEVTEDLKTDTSVSTPPKKAYVTVVDGVGDKVSIASAGIEYYKRQQAVFRAIAAQSDELPRDCLKLYEIAEIIEE